MPARVCYEPQYVVTRGMNLSRHALIDTTICGKFMTDSRWIQGQEITVSIPALASSFRRVARNDSSGQSRLIFGNECGKI